ncbi:prostaglandin E synthase 3-like [Tropilaelaps mercedesae]|uniref:Prostaglandin E synthase 3-like n=1 Tax=Tropilaelaps mercedesae TaxID=418985 RepID=A0A1V9X6A0_9ACAR|nr:prostaglandin E synthase 3-like [Tropilaelaps mercedesae]
MTGTAAVRNPVVLWAQRRDCIYLTIAVEDCNNAQVKIGVDKVTFKGTGGDRNQYECTLDLYGKLKTEECKFITRDRATEMLLLKDSSGDEFWPRLLKETTKMHWLKVDFNKWKDEDDSDPEDMSGGNFEEMMRKMEGFCGPDTDGGDFGDDADSDDEGLPDLEPTKTDDIDSKDNKDGEDRKE